MDLELPTQTYRADLGRAQPGKVREGAAEYVCRSPLTLAPGAAGGVSVAEEAPVFRRATAHTGSRQKIAVPGNR
jgi:hypothetical protein